MTWHLNGEPAPRDTSSGWLIINDVQYPPDWPHDDLISLGLEWIEPESPDPTAEEICRQIDAERDRRTALDFAYDFGATLAFDDERTAKGPGFGQEIAAGVRLLQMRAEDQDNWRTAQGAALTAKVLGAPGAIQPMRAEDNWNVQTTADQVLHVLSQITAHGAALLFHGGALKSQVRAAADPASVDWMTGWPGDV